MLKKFSVIAFVMALMAFLFWWGGDSPENRGWVIEKEKTVSEEVVVAPEILVEEEPEKAEEVVLQEEVKQEEKSEQELIVPEQPKQQETPTDNGPFCTLSVSCGALCDNLSYLSEEKVALVPENGIIFEEQKVCFTLGESVFDVLLREMQESKIHLEFSKTPAYDSVYIEGIANLYEFDAGEGSGWVYKVNGKTPAYGCSQYEVEQNDKIEFIYIIR